MNAPHPHRQGWTQPQPGSPIYHHLPAEWGGPSHEIVARHDGRYDLSRIVYPGAQREHVALYDTFEPADAHARHDARRLSSEIRIGLLDAEAAEALRTCHRHYAAGELDAFDRAAVRLDTAAEAVAAARLAHNETYPAHPLTPSTLTL